MRRMPGPGEPLARLLVRSLRHVHHPASGRRHSGVMNNGGVTRPDGTAARPADKVLAAAVDLARAAAEDAASGGVGAHLGAYGDDDRVVTHAFEASLPGYTGWFWAVTLARA